MHFTKPLYVTCVQWRGCVGVGVRGAPAQQVEVQSLYRNSNCFENFVTPPPLARSPTACTYAEVPSLFHMYVTWIFYKTTKSRSFLCEYRVGLIENWKCSAAWVRNLIGSIFNWQYSYRSVIVMFLIVPASVSGPEKGYVIKVLSVRFLRTLYGCRTTSKLIRVTSW